MWIKQASVCGESPDAATCHTSAKSAPSILTCRLSIRYLASASQMYPKLVRLGAVHRAQRPVVARIVPRKSGNYYDGKLGAAWGPIGFFLE
jgi:hypothetical protein